MKPRKERGDISLVALATLLLVALAIIVANTIMAGYGAIRDMWMAEAERVVVDYDRVSGNATVVNAGSVTVRIVSLWALNSTVHLRFEVSSAEGTLRPGEKLVKNVDPVTNVREVRAITSRGRVFAWEG